MRIVATINAEAVSKLTSKIKNLNPGQQLVTNRYELGLEHISYSDFVDAENHAADLGLIKREKLNNGYGGFDYVWLRTDA